MPIGALHLILAALLIAGAGTGAVAVTHVAGANGSCGSSDSSGTQTLHALDDANQTGNETENETEIADANDTGSDSSGCDSGSSSEDSNVTSSARSF